MKLVLFVFFLLLFSITNLLSPVYATGATLSLSPVSGTFNKGCTFSLEIRLDTGGVQTDGTDAILIYDSSKFSTDTSLISSNTSMYPDFPGNNVDESTGKITISGLASVSTPFSGKGTLATLQFSVKDSSPPGATQIKFEFNPLDKALTTDSNVVERGTVVDVLNSVVNGNYIIGTGTCGAATQPPAPAVLPKTDQGAVSTPSVQPVPVQSVPVQPVPVKTLPPAGSQELTFTLAVVGSVLTILGILGLALL